MINLRKISLLLVMSSLAVFAGCAGESSSSSIGNNAGSSSDTSYTISFTTITKGHINNILTDVIQNKKIATIQITTDGAHVVTFWGAGYDDNGFINKVYITDSALGNTLYNGKYGDFVSAEITYDGDTPYVIYDNYAKSKIDKIYIFLLGDDIWKEYYSEK